jgi:N-acetylmuramoyl-L-alanine amidase
MKIMLDAGHGYNTPGKRSPDGMREYEFNRVVANYAKKFLEEYEGVTVYFSHSDTKDISLQERTDKANRLNVDCFVSIHANAYGTGWNDARGIETFVYKTKPKEATQLAEKVQRQLVIATGLVNRGVKTANFHVLRTTTMPAILIECGFMTNKEEVKLLRSDLYRKTCAEAIVKGIQEHYKLKKKPTKTPKEETPVKPEEPAETPKNPEPPKQTEEKSYKVISGPFKNKATADKLVEKLNEDGFKSRIVYE